MGEVWKARDANLDRDVAIKVLHRAGDERSRERFRREALVLSRLSHPGVATIFDFDTREGCDFIVMEYVPGGTLASRIRQGPLSIDKVLRYGAAMAAALDAAHRSGFLHRDLKPANVVISADDHPKILDFGIALLLAGEGEVPRITQAGMALGSVPYMSPEQLFGDADDLRTDIYSLGVSLFEMATGTLPFMKDRPEALMYAIINVAAPWARSIRPDIPPALDALIGKCLAKERAQRPATAGEVAEELNRLVDVSTSSELRRPVRSAIQSIAVLPLRNVSHDPAQEYFVSGMTEAIISDFSRINALRVISRTSSMKYSDTTLSLPEVARELNVDAILEGSVLLIGNRVRMNVQLVRARDEETLWSDRYDRNVEDVLQLQSDLAETVVKAIEVQLTPREAQQLSSGRQEVDPVAYDAFLRSRHSAYSGTGEGGEAGLKHAKRALEIAPDFALAWTALADCQLILALRHLAPWAKATGDALAAAERAVQLDPSLGDAHASLGFVQFFTGKVRQGMEACRKAIQLKPSHAMAHNILARASTSLGRHEEAARLAQKAVALDPLTVLHRVTVGDAYYFSRQYEKAVLAYRIAVETDPRFDAAHLDLARSFEALGRFDEAQEAVNEAIRLSGPQSPIVVFGTAHLQAAMGNTAEARRILNEMIAARESQVVSAWGIAALHATLGDVDDAFGWLEIAVAERASGALMLRVHPRLDPIRGDPRYWPLVERLGLTD